MHRLFGDPYVDVEDEDKEAVVVAARLSACDIWLFSKCEAKLQHDSRVLLQASLGQLVPKEFVLFRRKMNSGGGRNMNWHKRFRK